MGAFTYYVITGGGRGGLRMLTHDYGGGCQGLDYVIKKISATEEKCKGLTMK